MCYTYVHVTYVHISYLQWTMYRYIHTYQWYDKGFLEAEAACDGEDWIKTREHGSKENDLSNARIDRKVGKVIAKGSELLITSKSILEGERERWREGRERESDCV